MLRIVSDNPGGFTASRCLYGIPLLIITTAENFGQIFLVADDIGCHSIVKVMSWLQDSDFLGQFAAV